MKPYYETEKSTLYHGDCYEVMTSFPDDCIDLTVTSPPYDNLRDYKGYTFDFENIAKELYRITKPGGVLVWVVGDATVDGSETGTSFKQALYFKELGFNLHDTMIYEKNSISRPSSTRYNQVFEYMFVFSKGTPKTISLIKDKKNMWAGSESFGCLSTRQKDGSMKKKSKIIVQDYGIRLNIWRYNTGFGYSSKDKMAFEHPATFPEKLAEDHIISWSNEGDTILDPMAGSGTTLKMAHILRRKYIGIEIGEDYCQIIKERLIIESQKRTLF